MFIKISTQYISNNNDRFKLCNILKKDCLLRLKNKYGAETTCENDRKACVSSIKDKPDTYPDSRICSTFYTDCNLKKSLTSTSGSTAKKECQTEINSICPGFFDQTGGKKKKTIKKKVLKRKSQKRS